MVLESGNTLVRLSYFLFKPFVPRFRSYMNLYERSGIHLVYEAYVSFAYLMTITVFSASLITFSFFHAFTRYHGTTFLKGFVENALVPTLLLCWIFTAIPLLFHAIRIYLQEEAPSGDLYKISLATLLTSLVLGLTIHSAAFYPQDIETFMWINLIPSFALSGVFALGTFGLMVFYPIYKNGEDRREIEDTMVFTVGFAAILASAGMGLHRVIERVAQIVPYESASNALGRVTRNLAMFGMDIESAIKEAAAHSASPTLAKILENSRTAAQTSGELSSYLNFEAKQLFQAKKEKLEKTMTTLMYLGETYIATFIVGPIVIILMLALLSSMGGEMMGLSPISQMNIVVFLGIPLIGAAFLVLLDMLVGESEV